MDNFTHSILFFVLLIFVSASDLKANHLVGGELSYECLGDNQFELSMIIYRDCDPNAPANSADFDNPATIFIVDVDGNLAQTITIPHDPDEDIFVPVNTAGICENSSPDLCVEYFEYTQTVTLPPSTGGYDIIYQRCCRNNGITNLIDPGGTGSTYELHIPHEDEPCNNSSPTFNNLPPLVVCQGVPFDFDYSATDLDGDVLVYEICDLFDGASETMPLIGDFANLVPYGPINWAAGYDAVNQLGLTSNISIDSNTGLLTLEPADLGKFVVGVCISEFRDGVLLSRKVRDYQFTVVPCDVVVADAGDDIFVCGSQTVMLDGSFIGDDVFIGWTPADQVDDASSLTPTVLNPTDGQTLTLNIVDVSGECEDSDTVTIFLSGASDSNPGTMGSDLLFACDGASVAATTSGSSLVGDAVLAYYLHTLDGNVLGDILDMNFSGSFFLPVDAAVNTTYYISAVVGEPDADGFPSLNDCFAVAPGTPVVFLAPVTVLVDEFCDTETGDFYVTVSADGGYPAFDNSAVYTYSNIVSIELGYGLAAEIALGAYDGLTYTVDAEDALGCAGTFTSDPVQCIKGLAIALSSFDAQRSEEKAIVRWTTATEVDHDYFEIERARDAQEFEVVGSIGGVGNSTVPTDYQFIDEALGAGEAYYRLVSIDINGKKSYSDFAFVPGLISVNNQIVTIGPNPVQDLLSIKFSDGAQVSERWNLRLYDAQGRVVLAKVLSEDAQLELGQLATGVYFVELQKGISVETKRIFKSE